MKKIFNIAALALVVLVAFSCTNKELEERLAKLEGQVAVLESRNGVSKAAPALPGAETAVAEPEVKPEGPLPVFEFPEENFDFGTIKEGEEVQHVFKFKNVGEAPLIISSATASCGCTVPNYPKEPIPVGGEGEIMVKFNSKGKPGIQNKTVTITSNTYPKTSRLQIKANVLKAEGENPS